MRAALGASANRIVRQLLAENIVLGLAGGVVGVFLAYWAVWWISIHGPAEIPRLDESRIDASTLAFACVVVLLSSFLFGLAPALRSASTRLNEAFKSASGVVGASRDRVRSLLADTGIRPEERFRMAWENVTWLNGRNGVLLVTHGKTAAARRVIPMTPRVRAILESRWNAMAKPEEGWVWPAATRSGHVEP